MKCYNHHDRDAVGVCKNCSKGICPDCLTEVDNDIACIGKCEGVLRAKSKQTKTNKKVLIFLSLISILFGTVVGYVGYESGRFFIIFTGVLYFGGGIFGIVRAKKNNR